MNREVAKRLWFSEPRLVRLSVSVEEGIVAVDAKVLGNLGKRVIDKTRRAIREAIWLYVCRPLDSRPPWIEIVVKL